MELSGAKKQKLFAACLLAVLSSAARIVPFFTIYHVILELLRHYTAIDQIDTTRIFIYSTITIAAAFHMAKQ